MPARNVRVDIPIASSLKMEILGDAILDRHSELGPSSPLNTPEIDMTAYETVHNLFREKFNFATGFHAQGEALTQQANVSLGVAPEQSKDTPGTIYFHMLRIRNFLLLVNDGTEEELTTYGYNVVIDKVRGRKVISVEIPIGSPDAMSKLGDLIIERHTELSPSSPLDTPELDMVEFNILNNTHKQQRKDAKKQHALGEADQQRANNALGVSPEQNIHTAGTVHHFTADIRDKLLIVNQSEEEELSTYGFNVVISTTPFPGEEEPTIIEGNVVAGATVGIFDELEDGTSLTLENTGTVPLTFCRMEDGVSACDVVAHITVDPSESTPVVGTDLGATGVWLNATNFDGAITGNFRVTVNG